MNTLEVLIEARKLIEKPENWCQGRFSGLNGERCAAGAYIDAAHNLCPNDLNRFEMLCDGAKAAFETACGTYTLAFNDAEGRTHAQVLAAFDRAIEAERAKVQP